MADATVPNFTIYNLPPAPAQWDSIGIFYICFCAIWSTLVVSGMIFCWFNRNNPILKIRSLPLSFGAISFLHCYWILAQITYPIGRTMPVVLAYDIQYFFMGIWFPLGIAMFQASNLRFLHVAKLQKQFAHPALDLRLKPGCNGAETSILCRIRNLRYSVKVMTLISAGMVAQVLLTIGMWFACKKYHPTFGIPGTEIRGSTLPEQMVDLGRGWEWWPSVLWQVIWTWIVAPILIWRAWGIRDTMGWRTQTIGCCISSLHATPMFLLASYVPAFAKINAYFTPSQWIHFSIMMFEIFTVFVPIFMVLRHKIVNKNAIESNNKWETSSQTSTLRSSTMYEWNKESPLNSTEKSGQPLNYMDEELGDRLITISALNYVLNENPGPLQEFSALSDFSGENIAFLTRTTHWKDTWLEMPEGDKKLEVYNRALEIYIDFISPRYAEFPLNLSSQELKALDAVFEQPARVLCGESTVNPATPFEMDFPMPGRGQAVPDSDITGRAEYTGEVPAAFNLAVFDGVLTHIKYLVLTNTWPKFLAEMHSRRRSSEMGVSVYTANSDTTLASRVSSTVSLVLSKLRRNSA